MHRCILSFFAWLFCLFPLYGQTAWDDISLVYKKAKNENKSVLIFFLSDDLCPRCKMIKNEIVPSPEFKKEVEERYVLMELKYLPSVEAALHDINGVSMTDQYGIVTHPVVIFTDSERRPFYSFEAGVSLENFLNKVKEANKVEDQFKQYMDMLPSLHGETRYEVMGKLFSLIPEDLYVTYYKDYINEALKNDLHDKSGQKRRVRKENEEIILRNYLDSMVNKISNDPDGAIEEIKVYIQKQDLLPESEQILMAQISFALSLHGKVDEAIETLQKAINMMPDSENADYFRKILKGIIKNSEEIRKRAENRR